MYLNICVNYLIKFEQQFSFRHVDTVSTTWPPNSSSYANHTTKMQKSTSDRTTQMLNIEVDKLQQQRTTLEMVS